MLRMNSISSVVYGKAKLHDMDLNFIVRQWLEARIRNDDGGNLDLRRLVEVYVMLLGNLKVAEWEDVLKGGKISPYRTEVMFLT